MTLIYDIIGNTPDISGTAFVTLCLASFFTSVVSATFGLGGGVMMIALMAFFLPPLSIIPLHAVIQMSSNFSRALMLWRYIQFKWMAPFVFGSFIGALFGGQIVFAMPKYLLQGIIGIFVLYTLWGPAIKALRPSHMAFFGIGSFASFVTMFVGATGPLVAPFVRAATDERRATVATLGAFMSWQHGVKILTFGLLGFAFTPYTMLLLGMILLGILGTWSGKAILTWMPEQIFRKAFNVVLGLLAIRLLYSAVQLMEG